MAKPSAGEITSQFPILRKPYQVHELSRELQKIAPLIMPIMLERRLNASAKETADCILFPVLAQLTIRNHRSSSYSGMAILEASMLTPEEFASLLAVGNGGVNGSAQAIPAAHSARLIALGYMIDLAGRLRMTTPGRIRIYAGQLAA